MNRRYHPALPYLLILPTLVFVLVFTVYPALSAGWGSLFEHRLNIPKFREPVFIGLGHYQDFAVDPEFRRILANTLLYAVILVPVTVTAALFLALWLRKKRFTPFRIAVFHPAILPMVSAATVWMFFFTPDYGFFNRFLGLFGYHGPENWISNPSLALAALMIVAFWKDAGFYMIYYLAGVQSLPKDVFEALRIEGAGPVTTFFRFTLPLLRRTTLFVTTIAVIGAFRAVDHVFVMTQGGPSGRSTLLLYHLWQVRFESLDIGKASAITVVLMAMLLAFTVSNFLLSERRGKDA